MKVDIEENLGRLEKMRKEILESVMKLEGKTDEEWQKEWRPRLERAKRRYLGWPEGSSPDDIEIA